MMVIGGMKAKIFISVGGVSDADYARHVGCGKETVVGVGDASYISIFLLHLPYLKRSFYIALRSPLSPTSPYLL